MNTKAYVFIGMGFELVGAVMAFLWIGQYLDEHQGWGGMGAAGGIVVAFIGWITHLLIVVRTLAKDTKEEQIGPP